jgi:ethanolamine ammonia-lyase small subunit
VTTPPPPADERRPLAAAPSRIPPPAGIARPADAAPLAGTATPADGMPPADGTSPAARTSPAEAVRGMAPSSGEVMHRLPSDEGSTELLDWIRQRTPARILVGRAGPAYRTATQLELRRDHAAAVDAVWAEVDLPRDLGAGFLEQWQLFDVSSQAATKDEYLRRPDLGRRLSDTACQAIAAHCPTDIDLQIVLSDGLSATAIAAQAPALLPLLVAEARDEGWRVGRPFFIHRGRVGLLNDIGRILRPEVVVLLIGERPGMATAESLSAYMAFRPRAGDTDARRNLVSNIHRRGVTPDEAARRIFALAKKMRRQQTSGVEVKED